jgi:MoaA/NifB/PqqE/SkfB family radical SAM enzyme
MTEREFGMIDMGLTRACNMRCKFCTAVGTHKNKKILSFEEFKCIFEKVEELINTKKIIMRSKFFSYGNVGEPLLNPDFVEINEYVRKRGWKTGMYTNGFLMTRNKMEEIYDKSSIDTINVSITGVSVKVYKEFQGYGFKDVKKILDIVLKNIEEVIKLRNEKNQHTKIAVNYIITKNNLWHIRKYVRYMKKLGVDEIRFTPLVDRPRRKKKFFVKCQLLDGIFNLDETAKISPCNNDLAGNIVIGNLFNNDWFEQYRELSCNNNCINIDKLPEACQVCDKTNFSSFWDYMSMNFHGYLEMCNHKIMWRKSFKRYVRDMWQKIEWYFINRYQQM